jgi:curved DNA-binding protein
MNKNYYSILGLERNASQDEIKTKYRQLAMKHHPDRNPDNAVESEEKFKEIKEAYEVLSNPDTRQEYDTGSTNHSSQQWAHRSNTNNKEFEDLFKNFFTKEDIFQQRKQTKHVLTISLADAYKGKVVRVDSKTIITIPAGARSGATYFVDNRLFQVDIQQHYKFKRSNDDLLVDVTIDAFEAMAGVEAILEHLDGVKLQFKIPQGIQPGQIIKLSGKGMKNPEMDRFGDVLVRVTITIPKVLTDEQKSIIEQLVQRKIITI